MTAVNRGSRHPPAVGRALGKLDAPLVLQLHGGVPHGEAVAQAGENLLQGRSWAARRSTRAWKVINGRPGLSDQMCTWCTSLTSGTVFSTVRAMSSASGSSGRPSMRTWPDRRSRDTALLRTSRATSSERIGATRVHPVAMITSWSRRTTTCRDRRRLSAEPARTGRVSGGRTAAAARQAGRSSMSWTCVSGRAVMSSVRG